MKIISNRYISIVIITLGGWISNIDHAISSDNSSGISQQAAQYLSDTSSRNKLLCGENRIPIFSCRSENKLDIALCLDNRDRSLSITFSRNEAHSNTLKLHDVEQVVNTFPRASTVVNGSTNQGSVAIYDNQNPLADDPPLYPAVVFLGEFNKTEFCSKDTIYATGTFNSEGKFLTIYTLSDLGLAKLFRVEDDDKQFSDKASKLWASWPKK